MCGARLIEVHSGEHFASYMCWLLPESGSEPGYEARDRLEYVAGLLFNVTKSMYLM